MTPEVAIAAMEEIWGNAKPMTLGLLEAIKDTETLRCVARVEGFRDGSDSGLVVMLQLIANDIRTSGGLAVKDYSATSGLEAER